MAAIRRYMQSYLARVRSLLANGTASFGGSTPARMGCGELLKALRSDTQGFMAEMSDEQHEALAEVYASANSVITNRQNGNFFGDFHVADLEGIRDAIDAAVTMMPEANVPNVLSEDSPSYFDVTQLGEHLEQLASGQIGNLAAFTSTLRLRIRGMLNDPILASVINRSPVVSFEDWLTSYVGEDGAGNGQIAIIDLSLLPSEIIHVVVAVLARLVFEALQQYRRLNELSLPTVLVLEEAHTFIKRTREEDALGLSAVHLCREAFEKIAREGRKFGLGLVLSSQRPAELSPTVLAQCNTFLLHRLVNDADQTLVARLVPDNVGALLRELPSLPSRQAVLLGWATPIPVLLEIGELAEKHRPQSADPDFWDVWTRQKEREIDWHTIADRWRGNES